MRTNDPIVTIRISSHITAQGRLLSSKDGIAEVDTGVGIRRGSLISQISVPTRQAATA